MRAPAPFRPCSEDGCDHRHEARGLCVKHYRRWMRGTLHPTYLPPPPPPTKIEYLSSLTMGELSAFCSGVLSRAAVTPGDPDEIAEWMKLVRMTAGERE